ncbi:cysteine-rich CWC family protein [Variovorax sp. RHLX14]|uniref:cysteine-rich CWC family protein n=1 Tax=Variovorax sp. RHLX14 TaxID=1259731 RepID=UPI003F45933C
MCAVEVARATGAPLESCWCMSKSFEQTLLDRVPPEARDLACICAQCADAANAAAASTAPR